MTAKAFSVIQTSRDVQQIRVIFLQSLMRLSKSRLFKLEGPCHPGSGGGVDAIFACSSSGIFVSSLSQIKFY